MAENTSALPGFSALSKQIFVREGDETKPAQLHDPDVVVIYGWGDCLPQHLAKYAAGYRKLFPAAKQVLVLSPIAKAMFTTLEQRSSHMALVLSAIGSDSSNEKQQPRTLIHAMSNTGAINFAATLNEHVRTFKEAMPHQLFIMDSTPGGTNLTWANLKRWSLAMTLGTFKWFPWPRLVTQWIWGFFLLANSFLLFLRRQKHAGAWSRVAANDEKFAVKSAQRLYMYSKEDALIGYKDIEEHAEEAKKLGYVTHTKVFKGSGHVEHMRMHTDEYWAAIEASWRKTTEEDSN